MPEEKDDQTIPGAGLADDPNAQALWDAMDEEEAGQPRAAAASAEDDPGAGAGAGDDGGSTPEPAAPAAGAAETDPLADVPQAVRDEILRLTGAVQQLSGRVRNTEGHIGGLRTQLQRDLQAAAAAATKSGSDAPNTEQIESAVKSPAALARLVDDYPEFGGAVKEVFDAQAKEIESLRKALTTAKPAADEDREAELQKRIVDLTIRIKHPDWKKEVSDPGFDPWVARQPREVQSLRFSDDPDDVIRLLDIRAAERKAKAAAEQNQDQATRRRQGSAQRAAAIPAGRSAASITAKNLDDLDPEAFWKHLDEVERA